MSASKIQEILGKLKETWKEIKNIIVYNLRNESSALSFRNIKMIGRGTFGVVIQIEDQINQRKYALKQVFQDSRFHNRELEIFKKIQHENIVKLQYYNYEEETSKGRYLNLFMEYHPYNLETLILDRNIKYNKFIKDWTSQIISALDYLHSRGICHRDIKPANLLLTDRLNRIVICDLGSAKVLEKGKNNIPYVCSRYYRSPENILGIETYDCKIDIWSAGCVLVECHTKETLFKGSGNREMLSQILSIVKCSKADLYEMGVIPEEYESKGIRKYLEENVEDGTNINLYEKMIVFNPAKRYSAKQLAKYIHK
ncbi:glycogen synthase kinase-3 beta (GSK3B) [Vairimorpha necatrix]|uniref:Glycogen synthase kinase-3 beta (GSK3B) n=1 Tax=Vairimorpha necatrix TaxID=6039 RepID=A0AAX4JBA8_9MICR